ncbi:hypothetical protein [Pontibacillus halophilus]|uniref:hypothetical protein n=1 Tax=Pontibacillus halophilus TaxID=516704 RepID=UPI0012B6583C|nr:hypothetical protein [Pontibacillus halophilus]
MTFILLFLGLILASLFYDYLTGNRFSLSRTLRRTPLLLMSAWVTPVHTLHVFHVSIELWIPIGFILSLGYLIVVERWEKANLRTCSIGFGYAIVLILYQHGTHIVHQLLA